MPLSPTESPWSPFGKERTRPGSKKAVSFDSGFLDQLSLG